MKLSLPSSTLKSVIFLLFLLPFCASGSPAGRFLLVRGGAEKNDTTPETVTVARPGSGGSLVIVGGGLETSNKSVFRELINRAGGQGKAVFAVIPSASGAPVQSYSWFRSELMMYGVDATNIHLIPIAMIDDDSTAGINESEWRNNGNNAELAEIVGRCSGVWFTGGDQLRTVRTLYNPDGSQTLVLKAVWEVYKRGGVIGGTSAGAAIMSEVMIAAGTSVAALTRGVITRISGEDLPEDSGVFVTRGLGFFPHGVVDQHFNQRARIGRLSVVLADQAVNADKKESRITGFGTDENTAIIFDAALNRMQVAGTGGVTIVDAGRAEIKTIKEHPSIRNLQVSYLEEGDGFDFKNGTAIPAPGKSPIHGREQFEDLFVDQAGILAPTTKSFSELYTRYLADNKRNDSIVTLTCTSGNSGFRLILRKSGSFQGYSSAIEGASIGYMVTGISMDIDPVRVVSETIE